MTSYALPALRRITFLGLPLALALLTFDALAEVTDREQPINYSANTGDVNYQTKVGTLTGNVIITQGTLSIRADKIVFRQNADNSMSATAHGNPVAFRQKRDGHDEYYEGYAQRVEYDGAKQLLELFDRALLKSGQDEIRSSYISYNASTEFFKAEGRNGKAPTGGEAAAADSRVRGVFQPKSDSPFPGKSKDSASGVSKAGTASPAGKGKDAATTPPKTPPPAPSLKAAGELAPPAR